MDYDVEEDTIFDPSFDQYEHLHQEKTVENRLQKFDSNTMSPQRKVIVKNLKNLRDQSAEIQEK
jgi:hypothetical protein